MTTPAFPQIDADRTGLHDAIGRVVLDVADDLEPIAPTFDRFVSLPVRISHNAGAGLVLEVGPYDLHREDVRRLAEAIERYRTAGGFA